MTLSDDSLLDPLLRGGERATLICANLPQTPGPAGFRLDRCGGDDGAGLICAFLTDLPRALTDDGEAFLLHIGLAHPARVTQPSPPSASRPPRRRADGHARLADYEALQPGLAGWLLAERAAGRAEFGPTATVSRSGPACCACAVPLCNCGHMRIGPRGDNIANC